VAKRKETKRKEYRITFSEIQRRGLLLLLCEAELHIDLKQVLTKHSERAAAYKAIRKLHNALPKKPKD